MILGIIVSLGLAVYFACTGEENVFSSVIEAWRVFMDE